jgi:aminocarboxymuconate-semialdehyde decarboxylase
LQDTDASLKEMHRCVNEYGVGVIQLATHVVGHYLGEPELRLIWRAINDLSLIAFIHPEGTKDLGYQKFRLWNSTGQPIEEAKCSASIIIDSSRRQTIVFCLVPTILLEKWTR